MINVRCAGRQPTEPSHSLYAWEPCGWQGERSHGQVRAVGAIDNPRRYVTTVATVKPCPRCGGRVALIGGDAS